MHENSFRLVSTKPGWFGLVVRGGRLVATYLPGPKAELTERITASFPDAEASATLLETFVGDVRRYFEGHRVAFRVQLDWTAVSPFRRRVLEVCRRIPYGRTASYAELARLAGNPKAARAAGGAMANNPLPLVIPCHRVLRSDGSIGGFSSPCGVSDKERMLRLEGIGPTREKPMVFRQAV